MSDLTAKDLIEEFERASSRLSHLSATLETARQAFDTVRLSHLKAAQEKGSLQNELRHVLARRDKPIKFNGHIYTVGVAGIIAKHPVYDQADCACHVAWTTSDCAGIEPSDSQCECHASTA
jgi:hypothetical protein